VPRTLPSSSWYSSQRDAHLAGDLALGRGAAHALLKLVHRCLDGALLLACAARQVVVAAQLIKHGAANALRGEGFELHPLRHIETSQRIGQADHADLDQVVEFDVGGQLGDHLVRKASHQRAVLLEHRRVVELSFGGVRGHGSAPEIQFSA
jgi:hypothetical protein